jgi:hypothetical protein
MTSNACSNSGSMRPSTEFLFDGHGPVVQMFLLRAQASDSRPSSGSTTSAKGGRWQRSDLLHPQRVQALKIAETTGLAAAEKSVSAR